MLLSRRPFLHTLLLTPIALSACGAREPETPLAHLHGPQWVHGAYEHYANSYKHIRQSSEQQTHNVYRVLAQKGIRALDGLQAREVPFHIRADTNNQRFVFQRNVPERLMFTADMSEADRQTATRAWKLARDHIHTDYDEIHRLDGSLTSLLQQLQRIRRTIDKTREEQFEITLQIGELAEGPTPFALPYQVTPKDYERVLFLLLERLQDDGQRLERIESAIVAVGFMVRATDANSGSLASNVRKVLLSVVEESNESKPRVSTFPQDRAKHDELLARGRRLYDQIRTSPEFEQWQKARTAAKLEQIGALLTVIDTLTGVPASAIFRQVMNIWSGNDDYLAYLKLVSGLIPGGGKLSDTLTQAVDTTQKVRAGADRLRAVVDGESPQDQVDGLLNVGSNFARSRAQRQLVFYRDQEEVRQVEEALASTDLMRNPLPNSPTAGPE